MGLCDECGFEWTTDRAATIETLRSFGSRYAALVAANAQTDRVAVLRTRPERSVWSPLEYAAHARDAIAWYAERIGQVLGESRPQLTAFDWDAAGEERRYTDEAPTMAVRELRGVSEDLADRLRDLDDDGWSRVGIGSDGGERTVLVLARRAVHEGVHHLHDIERVLARLQHGQR